MEDRAMDMLQEGGEAASDAARAGASVVADAAGAFSDLAREGALSAGPALDEVGENLGIRLAQVREAASHAPVYAAELFETGRPVLQDAAGKAGEGLHAIAVGAGAVAVAGAAFVSEHGAEAAAAVGAAGAAGVAFASQHGAEAISFLGSQMAAIPIQAWSAEAVSGIATIAERMRELGPVFSWIRLDVLIGAFQTVSLFFSQLSSAAMADAKIFFGNLSNILSIDWTFSFPSIPVDVVIGVLLGGALITLLLVCCYVGKGSQFSESIDEVRQGPEAKNWATLAEENKTTFKRLRWALMLGLTLYLPITKACFSVFFCDSTISSIINKLDVPEANCTVITVPGTSASMTAILGPTVKCSCYSYDNYKVPVFIAAVVFLLFSVGFPYVCLKLIKKNTPRGSTEDPNFTHNEDGVRVPYDDARYRKDLETDPRQLNNPFRTLYEGYERRWQYFKIWSMLMKAALSLAMVALWQYTVPQVAVCLVLIAAFTALAGKTTPFLDPAADFQDVLGRIASFLTALFGLVAAPQVLPGTATVMGILVNVVNAINFTIMSVIFLMGIRAVRSFCKRTCGLSALEFSNTVNGHVGNVTEIVVKGNWDLRLEVKHRLWQTFWNSFIAYVPPAPKDEGTGGGSGNGASGRELVSFAGNAKTIVVSPQTASSETPESPTAAPSLSIPPAAAYPSSFPVSPPQYGAAFSPQPYPGAAYPGAMAPPPYPQPYPQQYPPGYGAPPGIAPFPFAGPGSPVPMQPGIGRFNPLQQPQQQPVATPQFGSGDNTIRHQESESHTKDKKKQAPPPQFGRDVLERHQELQSIVRDVGKQRIATHFQALAVPGRFSLRQWIAWELEGVDVRYTGPLKEGTRSGEFGRLYTVPLPFHARWIADEGDGIGMIFEEGLQALINENMQPETLRMRAVRRQLRALEGKHVTFHHQQWETHTVADGVEHYTDKDGHRKTRPRHSSVKVWITYTGGSISIGRARPSEVMSEGFGPTLHLTGGTGVAVAPHTGQHHNITSSTSLSGSSIGVLEGYPMTQTLFRLLQKNMEAVDTGLVELETAQRQYRQELNAKRKAKEEVLSSAFWLHVYDCDTLPRPSLESYLRNCENNPLVRAIPDKHKQALDYLYGRLVFVRSHPCAAFWWCFLDDVWRNNRDHIPALTSEKEVTLTPIEGSPDSTTPEKGSAAIFMNPLHPRAFAYRPMPRKEFEQRLGDLKLVGRFGLFNKRVLDGLYGKLEEIDKDWVAGASERARLKEERIVAKAKEQEEMMKLRVTTIAAMSAAAAAGAPAAGGGGSGV